MPNRINRNIEPTDPTQGRRRECARRVRQMERQRQKATVNALNALPDDALMQMAALDDAQCGFVEDTVERALIASADGTPDGYARAIVLAAQQLAGDSDG
jgi:hypothetical protein